MPKVAVIAGSGVAGLTAAIAAHDAGYRVTLYDLAPQACYYSSSRNAAIARSYEPDPALFKVARKGLLALWQIPALFKPVGLLINPWEYDYNFEPNTKRGDGFDEPDLRPRPGSYTLPDGKTLTGQYIPDNGIIDISAVARHLVGECQRRGVSIFFNTRVHITKVENGFIREIALEDTRVSRNVALSAKTGGSLSFGKEFRTNARENQAEGKDFPSNAKENQAEGKDFRTNVMEIHSGTIVINAAGAWARDLGKEAGRDLPIIPHKRHLYRLVPPHGKAIPLDLPIIWDEKTECYLRPDGEAILATPGDQTPTFAGDYTPDPLMFTSLIETFRHHLPWFADFKLETAHACLRSFSMDNRPVLGYDQVVQNLFWNAGWGGHGMTISLGMIAEIECELGRRYQGNETELDNPFTPTRFS